MAVSSVVQKVIDTGSTYHSQRASTVQLTGFAVVASSVRSYEKQLNNLMADAQRSRAEADALADQQSAINQLDFPAGDDQASLYADPADLPPGLPSELRTEDGTLVDGGAGEPLELNDEMLTKLDLDRSKLPCEKDLGDGCKIYVTKEGKMIVTSGDPDTVTDKLNGMLGLQTLRPGDKAVTINHEDATALLASIQKRQSALQMEDQLRTLQMTQTLNSIAQMIEAASNLCKKENEIAESLARNIGG